MNFANGIHLRYNKDNNTVYRITTRNLQLKKKMHGKANKRHEWYKSSQKVSIEFPRKDLQSFKMSKVYDNAIVFASEQCSLCVWNINWYNYSSCILTITNSSISKEESNQFQNIRRKVVYSTSKSSGNISRIKQHRSIPKS